MTNYLKLFMESYFDVCFCVLINLIGFKEALDTGTIGDHFATWYDFINSSATIFYSVVLVMFPWHAFKVIYANFEALSTDRMLEEFGIYYEDYRTKTRATALYNVFFMVRRLVTSLILVFMRHLPFF
jgi:hypothetical protein